VFAIKGAHNTAYTYSSSPLEPSARAQVISFLDTPVFAGVRIAIMPDAHAGAGCVVGFTAGLSDKVVPNVVGVDQGCGVAAWRLGSRVEIGEKHEKLDQFIRAEIPFGRTVRPRPFDEGRLSALYQRTFDEGDFKGWRQGLLETARATEQEGDYVLRSLGTLGGGNHFIEIDRDEQDGLWLVIHSGSRNFGLKSCGWHQRRAEKTLPKKGGRRGRHEAGRSGAPETPRGLAWLEGAEARLYYEHLRVAQGFARLNRHVMALAIIEDFFALPFRQLESVESVHNYVDFTDRVLRKGAISARAGERVIIPLNMADGTVIGRGRGNRDWNWSAPHGAGRTMSRSEAKRAIDLSAYKGIMRERQVWSSCVGPETLDEAPQAYKDAQAIIADIGETVEVTSRLLPTYNFKASE
jgi:tRNA-splicing ligase RtcB (3'-phosphate/5'-hydroxy nucleic acid ligase)